LQDVKNIKQYLIDALGFRESEMLILMDDKRHHAPTKRNIEDAFRRMTEYSAAGDVVFVHYSGHVRACSLFLLSSVLMDD
jgi:metacaspase-1